MRFFYFNTSMQFTINIFNYQAVVKGIPLSECKTKIGASNVKSPVFCMEPAVSNICSGDSGGPATLKVTRDGSTRHELYGITSYAAWTMGRCLTHLPYMYAKITDPGERMVVVESEHSQLMIHSCLAPPKRCHLAMLSGEL